MRYNVYRLKKTLCIEIRVILNTKHNIEQISTKIFTFYFPDLKRLKMLSHDICFLCIIRSIVYENKIKKAVLL